MKDDDLPAIAEKAINSVLRYHDENHTGITFAQQGILNDRIAELLPLKSTAADPDTANIEVIADAAMCFLDLYNWEHGDNPVDEKWMYIGVQCLASVDLKPSLVCGIAPRLPVPGAPPDAAPANPNENNNISPGVASHQTPQRDDAEDGHAGNSSRDPTITTHETPMALRPARKRDGSTQDGPAAPSDEDEDHLKTTPRSKKRRSNGPQVANGKESWGDEEIGKLIRWKVQGMTHKEVGAILGRTEPACAIRHSIVLKQDKWVRFARECREKRAAGQGSDEEGENGAVQKGENGAVEKGENGAVQKGENGAVQKGENETVDKGENGAVDEHEIAKDGENIRPVVEPEVVEPAMEVLEEMPQPEDGGFGEVISGDEDPREEDCKE